MDLPEADKVPLVLNQIATHCMPEQLVQGLEWQGKSTAKLQQRIINMDNLVAEGRTPLKGRT